MILTYNYAYQIIAKHLEFEISKYPHFKKELTNSLSHLDLNLKTIYLKTNDDRQIYHYLVTNYNISKTEIDSFLKPMARYKLNRELLDLSV